MRHMAVVMGVVALTSCASSGVAPGDVGVADTNPPPAVPTVQDVPRVGPAIYVDGRLIDGPAAPVPDATPDAIVPPGGPSIYVDGRVVTRPCGPLIYVDGQLIGCANR